MNDRFDEVVKTLADAKEPVCVTAAAGCGKTETIVRAVALAEGKQLILTHTNAGVAALRSRLRKNGVSESKYRVETIASWLLKYVSAYSSMSGLLNPRPQGDDWKKVYHAAQALFGYRFIRDVLLASYTGVFVDEYQDCTQEQHKVISTLSEFLPVRVLGDPLQGIFGFQDDPLVEWPTIVQEDFRALPDLADPYRWMTTNPTLGDQLAEIRSRLLAHEKINLGSYSEIQWYSWSEEGEQKVCLSANARRSGTIAAIHQWPEDAHDTARRIGGRFQSMEEMDCKYLMEVTRKIDGHGQNYRAIASCIKNLILRGCANPIPFTNNQSLQNAFGDLEGGNILATVGIMDLIIGDPGAQVYRRELLTEMRRAAQELATGKHASLEEAAYAARGSTRVNGRKLERCLVSRTPLIKGLEFDYAIVLNADKLENRENFYVAVTRGSRGLTVLSKTPEISFREDGRKGTTCAE